MALNDLMERKDFFFQVINRKIQKLMFTTNKRKQTNKQKKVSLAKTVTTQFLQKYWPMGFIPFDGNTCTLQLYFVKIDEILLSFGKKLQ